jgi:hypothetical protein
MSLAQKKARENFKKAIAYRKKTGCSLKQAFAYVKGGKVTGVKKAAKKKALKKVVRKKAAKKKAVSSHKDTRSHNVNIRVVSGVDMYKIRDMLEKEIKNNVKMLELFKTYPFQNVSMKKISIKRVKANILIQKKQLREQNKLITQNLK